MIELALQNNYYIKVDELEDGHGVSVYFPKNFFLDKNELSLIYMISNDGVELYNNSFELLSNMKCPEFSSRAIIMFDILIRAHKMKIKPELVLCFREGVRIGNYTQMKKIMKDPLNLELEKTFIQALQNIENQDYIVDKCISDIFNLVKTNILTGATIC